MAETTKIEWADATISLWWGCTKVSPGCAGCYAEAFSKRWGKRIWGPGAPREDHRASARKLALKLHRQAEREGRTLRVFCASMADWLDPEVPAEWLADLLALIGETPHLTWMLLTKRPELWGERVRQVALHAKPANRVAWEWQAQEKPPANVWVGTTVEDQERCDQRLARLCAIPASVRFLSCEPLLGPLNLRLISDSLVHWVICGGESGRGARPMHPEWARSLRDQCQAAGVAYFFKQWGEWAPGFAHEHGAPTTAWHQMIPGGRMAKVGKKLAGRLLDGRTWDEVPS